MKNTLKKLTIALLIATLITPQAWGENKDNVDIFPNSDKDYDYIFPDSDGANDDLALLLEHLARDRDPKSYANYDR
ncbi:MAG TPA: hypothetical protein PKD37_06505 [Oligoflexia bacterium]|nr:hypothetical protein [Oligoflexia bacterium]HMP27612.1 hypothetical protein [Oligoflexia bacterium]